MQGSVIKRPAAANQFSSLWTKQEDDHHFESVAGKLIVMRDQNRLSDQQQMRGKFDSFSIQIKGSDKQLFSSNPFAYSNCFANTNRRSIFLLQKRRFSIDLYAFRRVMFWGPYTPLTRQQSFLLLQVGRGDLRVFNPKPQRTPCERNFGE